MSLSDGNKLGNKRTAALSEVVGQSTLVRLDRTPLDPFGLTGYIVGLSEQLILLHVLLDQVMQLNGYVAIRKRNVKKYKVYNAADDFMSRVLPLLDITPILQPALDINSIHSLLSSAQGHYSLIGLELEEAKPDALIIGTVENLSARTVALRTIDSAGRWDDTARLLVKEISRVTLGDGYQEALSLLERHEATLGAI